MAALFGVPVVKLEHSNDSGLSFLSVRFCDNTFSTVVSRSG